METWLTILLVIAVVAVLILGLSLLSSVMILGASKRYFAKEQQEDAKKIQQGLPGSDCGQCGLGSCSAYAMDCAKARDFGKQCPYLDEQVKTQMEQIFSERAQLWQQRLEQEKTRKIKSEGANVNDFD